MDIERGNTLGRILVYNRFPEEILRHDNVKNTTKLAIVDKEIILSICDEWKYSLSPRIAENKNQYGDMYRVVFRCYCVIS